MSMSENGQIVEVCDGYRKVYTPVKGLEHNDNYFLTVIKDSRQTNENAEGNND